MASDNETVNCEGNDGGSAFRRRGVLESDCAVVVSPTLTARQNVGFCETGEIRRNTKQVEGESTRFQSYDPVAAVGRIRWSRSASTSDAVGLHSLALTATGTDELETAIRSFKLHDQNNDLDINGDM